jgi:hypothetical protein
MTTATLTNGQIARTTTSSLNSTTLKLTRPQPATSSFSLKSTAKQMAITMLEGSLPFAAYMALKATLHTSDIIALSIGALIPAAFSVVRLVRNRRVDITSMIILLSIAASILAVAVGGSPQILLIRESAFGAVFGLVLLASLAFPRPLFFYMMRQMRAGNDSAKIAAFNEQWGSATMMRSHRIVTTVWGIGCLAEFALRVFFVFTLPVPVVLALSGIVFPVIYFGMFAWTVWYMRGVYKKVISQAVAQ